MSPPEPGASTPSVVGTAAAVRDAALSRELAAVQQRTLARLFAWSAVVVPSLFVVFAMIYVADRERGALLLAAAFGGLLGPLVWAWRELRAGRAPRAQRIFLSGATVVVCVYLLYMPASLMLVGVMGLFLFVRFTTAFEPRIATAATVGWGGLFVVTYAVRYFADVAVIHAGRAEPVILLVLPLEVLILFAMVDVNLGRVLVTALAVSERRGDELSVVNRSLELQQERLEELARRRDLANDALVRANAELRSFAYAVSHDLRAPLINIQGFAAELRRELAVVEPVCLAQHDRLSEEERRKVTRALGEDIPEALRFIDSSIARMDALIAAILKLSRIGHRELHLERVDVGAIVRATLATMEHKIKERGVRIDVGDLPAITSDALAVTQIVSNLLANAITYLQPGRPGEVRVSARADAGGVPVYAVADNGRGIAEGDRQRVFELFRRVGRSSEPGEGMGLAYVDAQVRALGGRVWCESVEGEGATFYFTLGPRPEATTGAPA